jgi:hypothetical protein
MLAFAQRQFEEVTMSIDGLIFIEVRHNLASRSFIADIREDRNKPSKTETFETEAALLAFLRKFNLERWTPELVLEQLNLPPRKDEKSRQFLVIAREAAKGAAV